MSGFRGHSTTAQPVKQKIPSRRKTPHVSFLNALALAALASDVIPAVTMLQRLLLKDTDEEQNYTSAEALF